MENEQFLPIKTASLSFLLNEWKGQFRYRIKFNGRSLLLLFFFFLSLSVLDCTCRAFKPYLTRDLQKWNGMYVEEYVQTTNIKELLRNFSSCYAGFFKQFFRLHWKSSLLLTWSKQSGILNHVCTIAQCKNCPGISG